MFEQDIETAKSLLEQKKYAEAGKIFRQAWEQGDNSYAASQYLYCLRKAGYPQPAIQQGKKAGLQFENNTYIQRELIWAHYDLLKIAQEEENLSKVIQIAETILENQPEDMALEKTVLGVIKLAKQQKQWQTVSDWCDQINPEIISDKQPLIGDQKVKSNKEQWYFAKVKSLIEIESWHQARRFALEAAKIYPKEINFPRWAALGLKSLGKNQDAIEEFKQLILKYREEWYVFQDLSDLYQNTNQLELALRFACKAALAPGEDHIKITLYQEIAQIGLLMNKLEMAARHIQLCKSIRQQQNWRIKANLEQLELDINQAFSEQNMERLEDCGEFNDLRTICRQYWLKESYQGLPRQKGYIESIQQDKPYGWIRSEDGKRVFFLQKELPKFLRKEKLNVDFALEESWDNSKNKLSFKAVNIKVEK